MPDGTNVNIKLDSQLLGRPLRSNVGQDAAGENILRLERQLANKSSRNLGHIGRQVGSGSFSLNYLGTINTYLPTFSEVNNSSPLRKYYSAENR